MFIKTLKMIKQKQKGDIVKVYETPMTRNKLEGLAELYKKIPSHRDNHDMENWTVVFVSDGFICDRMINKEDLKK